MSYNFSITHTHSIGHARTHPSCQSWVHLLITLLRKFLLFWECFSSRCAELLQWRFSSHVNSGNLHLQSELGNSPLTWLWSGGHLSFNHLCHGSTLNISELLSLRELSILSPSDAFLPGTVTSSVKSTLGPHTWHINEVVIIVKHTSNIIMNFFRVVGSRSIDLATLASSRMYVLKPVIIIMSMNYSCVTLY